MIALFTDFGPTGPYTGQMKAVLYREAPGVPVVDLMCDAPAFNPRASAYLLAALSRQFPPATVLLCVVDPGVGSASRAPVVVEADGVRFVGPGNGLFEAIAAAAPDARGWEITWRPGRLSSTFHGRDLFAPVAAMLARGEPVPGRPLAEDAPAFRGGEAAWPPDLPEIIYVDHYGNAMTGLRAGAVPPGASFVVRGREIGPGRTFSDAPQGAPMWYVNSIDLVEIAVNRGSAAQALGLQVGDPVELR